MPAALAHADYSAGRAAEARGDRERALFEYVRAADADPRAAMALARLHESDDAQGSAEQALRWLRRAADLGDAQAQYRLGLRYLEGRGAARREPREAAVWFERAARSGHAGAQFELGRLFSSGPAAQPERAQALIEQAAEAGEPAALRWLGREVAHAEPAYPEPTHLDPRQEDFDPAQRASRRELPRYWDEDPPRVTLHWGISQGYGNWGWSLWDPYPWSPWYPWGSPYHWGASPWAWNPYYCPGAWCGTHRHRHGGVHFGFGIAN